MPKIYKWMSGLKDDRKLIDLCLPGSHDAGVYEDKDRGVKTPGSKTRCQYKNIYEQARDGSRVFDIRCWLKDGKPTMGHFFQDTPTAVSGDWGGTLESALDDAVKFLDLYVPSEGPSEFLIFRIGHTQCTKEVIEVLKTIDPTGGKTTDPTSGKLKYANFILKGKQGNLANLQVKDLRGKLLLIFGEEFHENFNVLDGYYPYVKYPNIPQNGLSFCGTYSGGATTAASFLKEDRGNWTKKGAVKVALAASEQHKNHKPPDDHLFWVYWQQTGGDVEANTTTETGCMHSRLEEFLSKFRTNKLRLPNVIGHDFVKYSTCSKIVKMNSDLAATLEPEF